MSWLSLRLTHGTRHSATAVGRYVRRIGSDPGDLDLGTLDGIVTAMLADAGEIALRWFRSDVVADDKGGVRGYDPVTIADRDIEAALRAQLAAAFPGHRVVGEEFGTSGPAGRYEWWIDPIDGTKAFVTGSPLWGTLLGLLDNGIPVAGWIHQPFLDETFSAAAGHGAWYTRAGRRRRMATRRGRAVEDAVVYCTTPTMFTDPVERAIFDELARRVRLVRYGGDCYSYAQLALGHVDIVLDTGLQPYDIVAPIAIVEEAGGRVLGRNGCRPADGGFVATVASPELAAVVGALIGGAGAEA